MIVDSSAIIAMVREETGYERLFDKLINADGPKRMAAPNYVEAAIVADGKRDPSVSRTFDAVLEDLGIEVVPFSPEHARFAREAYRDFGKGSGHPAKLNFGDCMAYALARDTREPLLFVGNDFTHTDIEAA
jgi:ribonuclease VapC